jgi:cobalt-zinc-cadmium efflux system outer membrane protein
MSASLSIANLRILLVLLALQVLSFGCSTPRHTIATSSSTSAMEHHSSEAIAVDGDLRVSSTESPSPVRTVAHQSDEKAGADEAVQLTIPLELAPLPVPHEPEYANGLTLEAIELIAVANNPAIKQASAASAKAGGIRTQVGLKPNPTFGYDGVQLADAGTDQHSLFIEQTFVRGDKLAWNRRVIGHDVNVMNWMVETQRERLRTDIRLAFYEALAAQKRLELSREFRTVAKEGVNVSEEQVKAAVGTRPDVLQSEIQLSEVDLAIQQAEFDFSAACNELAALAGVPDLGQAPLIGNLSSGGIDRNSEDEFAQIVATSPLLAAAQARVCRAKSNLERQRVQPVSNVTGHLGAGHDNGTGHGFVNVQLSLPVPVHNKNQGNIRAAYAEYCAATQNVDRLRVSIRRDLTRVMREYQVAEASVRQYKEAILPKAQEALELVQEGRDAGEFDFLRVLTARRAYFDANIKYVVALGQLARANAKIDGLLLTGGLSNVASYDGDDSLRGQALSGQ